LPKKLGGILIHDLLKVYAKIGIACDFSQLAK
jgi:hypothetical protein